MKPTAMGMFLTSLGEKFPKSVIFTGLSYQIGSQLERQLPPSLIEVPEKVAAERKTETDADVTKSFLSQLKPLMIKSTNLRRHQEDSQPRSFGLHNAK